VKSIVTQGTVDVAPCRRCRALVKAYFSYGSVESNGRTVRDVMRAICMICGEIVNTSPQSAHRFIEVSPNRRSKRITIRIPLELQDFICLNLTSVGTETSNTGLYLTALLLACHGQEKELGPMLALAESPVLSRPNKIAVSLYLGRQLSNTLVNLATESRIANTSEVLRRLLVLADGPLERDVSQELERLANAYT
jgi:hypothetical protein